jgi:receptor expression-enhancing protein 5/6
MVPPTFLWNQFLIFRLTYWTVFGAFNVLESFSESLLGWVPFYFVIKCAVIVYLALPQTKV